MRVVVIRFNPDSYEKKDGLKIKSCFSTNKSGILKISSKKEWEKRLNLLKEKIEYHINNIPDKEITEEYLYYDNFE